MVVEAADQAARSVRPAPVGAELELPPLRPVAKIDRALWRTEDERARPQHVRQRARIVLRVRLDLGEGDVAGRLHKLAELAVGDGRAIDPEAIDPHLMRRGFLRIVPVGAHAEGPALDPDHVLHSNRFVRWRACFQSDSGTPCHRLDFRNSVPPVDPLCGFCSSASRREQGT
jgi:hypothetical protein